MGELYYKGLNEKKEAKEQELLKLKLYHLSSEYQKLLRDGIYKYKGAWAPDFQPCGFFAAESPEHCMMIIKRNKQLEKDEALLELDVEIKSQRIWKTNMNELKKEYNRWITENYEKGWGADTKQKWTDYLSQKYDAIEVDYPEDSPGWKKEVIILEPSIIKSFHKKDIEP